MIDEKKLIEVFKKLRGSDTLANMFISDVIKLINKQPKVLDSTQNVDGWISCSERLPERAGFYVVTKRQKSGEIQVALGSYRPLFNEWSGNGNFKDVLAWQPLPEPYKEE